MNVEEIMKYEFKTIVCTIISVIVSVAVSWTIHFSYLKKKYRDNKVKKEIKSENTSTK